MNKSLTKLQATNLTIQAINLSKSLGLSWQLAQPYSNREHRLFKLYKKSLHRIERRVRLLNKVFDAGIIFDAEAITEGEW